MTQIYFIHGLNSSSYSFAYISKELDPLNKTRINYNSCQSLTESVIQVAKQLPRNEEIILVGHSLGGVIALLIAQAGNHTIKKVCTISAPLGGSKAAVFARWFAKIPVLNDITPRAPLIRLLSTKEAPCPVLSIVSTGGGLATSPEPNDSVVTVASQRAVPYSKKVEIKANHFEVLMRDEVVQHIRKFTQD